MTKIRLLWNGKLEDVQIDSWHPTTRDHVLQKHMEFEARSTLMPIVNREQLLARLLIRNFGGGEIVSEPPFDPNQADLNMQF